MHNKKNKRTLAVVIGLAIIAALALLLLAPYFMPVQGPYGSNAGTGTEQATTGGTQGGPIGSQE